MTAVLTRCVAALGPDPRAPLVDHALACVVALPVLLGIGIILIPPWEVLAALTHALLLLTHNVAMTGKELRAQALAVRYRTEWVLDGLDLAIQPGSVTAVVGPNGSGKSTLIKALARLVTPERGSVLLDGSPCTRCRPARSPASWPCSRRRPPPRTPSPSTNSSSRAGSPTSRSAQTRPLRVAPDRHDHGTVVADGSPADVITPELLGDVFRVETTIMTDPITGVPICIGHRAVADREPSPRRHPQYQLKLSAPE